MKNVLAGIAAAAGALCAPLARAASANTTAAATTTPVTGQLASLALSTLAVVAIIVIAAWLLKRMAPYRHARNDMLHMVAGMAVGQRERVVVVEIGGTWLVLGVAPGSIRTLHHMPRVETPATLGAPVATPPAFTHWLAKFTKKHNENK
jgi:flagellar protein FliO/FliZ